MDNDWVGRFVEELFRERRPRPEPVPSFASIVEEAHRRAKSERLFRVRAAMREATDDEVRAEYERRFGEVPRG